MRAFGNLFVLTDRAQTRAQIVASRNSTLDSYPKRGDGTRQPLGENQIKKLFEKDFATLA